MRSRTAGVPISLFESVECKYADAFECAPWSDVVDLLSDAAAIPTPSKTAAYLMASAEFDDGRRLKAKALRSGMVILDVDDGATVEDAEATIEDLGVEAVVYTTASHKASHHKFRVCVPLAEIVTPDEYTAAWRGLNEAFGGIADSSKTGCESLFYLPGDYPGVPNRFHHFEGDVGTAGDWAEAAPQDHDDAPAAPAGAAFGSHSGSRLKKLRGRGKRTLDLSDVIGVPLLDHPLVSESARDAYLDTTENWHHARYRFMCSVAARASRFDCPLDAQTLVAIFNDLDLMDGGHYQDKLDQQALLGDAKRALGFAGL